MQTTTLKRIAIAGLYLFALYCAWFGYGASSKYDTITEVLARVSFDEKALPLLANVFILRPFVALVVTLFVVTATHLIVCQKGGSNGND
jgi:hypothetical protein